MSASSVIRRSCTPSGNASSVAGNLVSPTMIDVVSSVSKPSRNERLMKAQRKIMRAVSTARS
ncbi:hypothetical protein CZ765_07055 [Corynebacterium casei]|nr:hypothetical protein [Corynebacterium casei]SLM90237.1 hypothetical protein CZ765_07055 [Corynebacterium casei]